PHLGAVPRVRRPVLLLLRGHRLVARAAARPPGGVRDDGRQRGSAVPGPGDRRQRARAPRPGDPRADARRRRRHGGAVGRAARGAPAGPAVVARVGLPVRHRAGRQLRRDLHRRGAAVPHRRADPPHRRGRADGRLRGRRHGAVGDRRGRRRLGRLDGGAARHARLDAHPGGRRGRRDPAPETPRDITGTFPFLLNRGRIIAYLAAMTTSLAPTAVLPTLREHLLVDGFDLVLDLTRSHGSTLVDARDGPEWLDLFTFFASS